MERAAIGRLIYVYLTGIGVILLHGGRFLYARHVSSVLFASAGGR